MATPFARHTQHLTRLLTRAKWAAWDQRIRVSDQPIIIGPWVGELGFEILYGLPYLMGWRRRYRIASRRLYVIGRGGTGELYGAWENKDLYTLKSLEECRIHAGIMARRNQMLKQIEVTDFDQDVVRRAADAWGLKRYHVWHWSRMFNDLTPWWEDRLPVRRLVAQLVYEPLPHVEVPPTWQLPAEFVAVRFYARATFPLCADTIHFTEQIVGTLAKRVPVVLLNSGLFADDHVDFDLNGPNILRLPRCAPEDNLRLQAAVLARASGFVGTYGGFAQMALRLGVPSLSFYYRFGGTAAAHLTLSQLLSLQSGTAFTVLPVAQAPLLRGLLG